jgi:hypothetical protein
MSFKTISEPDWPDYEIWTCDDCGYGVSLNGTGGDVSECPRCLARSYEEDARREVERQRDEETEEFINSSHHSEDTTPEREQELKDFAKSILDGAKGTTTDENVEGRKC